MESPSKRLSIPLSKSLSAGVVRLWLCRTAKWMASLTCHFHDPVCFCLGHITCESVHYAEAFVVNMQHHVLGLSDVLVKESHQYVHDEFHRRVVVIVKNDLIASRPLSSRSLYDAKAVFFVKIWRVGMLRHCYSGTLPTFFYSVEKIDQGCTREYQNSPDVRFCLQK